MLHFRWTEFDECLENVKHWFKDVEQQFPVEFVLRNSLVEKQSQLESYRNVLYDIVAHKQDVVDLKDRTDNLPERNEKIEHQLRAITEQHEKLLKRVQQFVERYETIVSNHQQFNKALEDVSGWIVERKSNVILWGDTDQDRVNLCLNLERLKVMIILFSPFFVFKIFVLSNFLNLPLTIKIVYVLQNLQATLPDDSVRVSHVISLGDKIIAETKEDGQTAIRSLSNNLQQEWTGLISHVDKTIEIVQGKLGNWSEFEILKDNCLQWIQESDKKLHQIDLKATLQEKKDQLNILKELQGEIRVKELEIDRVTERGQQLKRLSRSSQVSDLGIKYQQICHKVKDLTTRWQQYVNNHQDFDSKVEQCQQWLDDIKNKLTYCSDLSSANQKDLEIKLAVLQDLILFKEEGFGKIQSIVELVQIVLANTATHGHEAINKTVTDLQEQWSTLATKMIETKSLLDDSILKWTRLLEQTQGLNKTIEWLQVQLMELSELQANIPEKKAQLNRIKVVEEKVRCEKIEVDNLKLKAADMLASGQQGQAKVILDKFDELFGQIQVKSIFLIQ